jgi:tRNA(Ile)-lysidine synthase
MTPDPRARFVRRVRDTIVANDLLPRSAPARPATAGLRRGGRETVIVGISGGPDSVALLRVLHGLARKGLAIDLVAAHLHHGLRGAAADADQAFVERLAKRLKIPCETGRADIRQEAAAGGIGLEEAGRLARRRFLAEVARRHGARKIALGHHADDRAETVLFNILRGTGVEGLAVLGPRAPLVASEGLEIIRPLIDVPRDLILAYLRRLRQPWREDETNRADAHTRNRIRKRLLPLMRKEINPKVEEALARLSDQAAAAAEVLGDAVDAVWRQIVREVPSEPAAGAGDGRRPAILIDADDFATLRPWLQGAIVRRAIERLGGGLKHMSAERTREVVSALLAKTVAGPIDLPGGLVVARRRRAIRIAQNDTMGRT